MRSSWMFLLWLAAGCAPQLMGPPVGRDVPRRVGELGYADTDALADGIVLTGLHGFRTVRLVATTSPEAVFSWRVDAESPWVVLQWAEDLQGHRTTEIRLDAPSESVELRADGEVSFLQFELFEGAVVYDDDPGAGGNALGRAVPGMWTLSDDVWEVGQTMYLPYEPALACTGSLLSGTRALGDYLVAHFGATSFGGYNCRTIGGTTTLSVHSTGRAIDVYVPTDGVGNDSADNDLGDPIGDFLITHSEDIGVSYVIWDQASWGAHRTGDKHQSYGGVHPHNNHLHVELTTAGATEQTPWFTDGGPDVLPETELESEPAAGEVYLVGDWDGDGDDDLAVRRGGQVLMDTNGGGGHELEVWFGDGAAEDEYLVGDWDGDGGDDVAVRRGGQVLMDTNGGGGHELEVWFGDGAAEDEYLVGDWDGDGDDNVAVRRGAQVLMDTTGGGGHELEVWFGEG